MKPRQPRLPPKRYEGLQGTIYLLHFNEPYKHAQHYLGWTIDLEERLRAHERGIGRTSALTRAVVAAGITWVLARTWRGDTYDEKKLKGYGSMKRLCPICLEADPGIRRRKSL